MDLLELLKQNAPQIHALVMVKRQYNAPIQDAEIQASLKKEHPFIEGLEEDKKKI